MTLEHELWQLHLLAKIDGNMGYINWKAVFEELSKRTTGN